MHIPNTSSLTSARNNRRQKFQCHFSSVNFILIMLQNQGITLRFYPTPIELSKIQIYQVASVTVHGACNKKDLNTVLLAEFNDRNPVFGSLEKIWLCGVYICFGQRLYQTVDFTTNLHAYEIKDEDLPSVPFITECKIFYCHQSYTYTNLMTKCIYIPERISVPFWVTEV